MRNSRPEPESFLFFDFGGTLDADGLSWEARFHAVYRRAGGSLTRDHFDALFTEAEFNFSRVRGIRSVDFAQTVEGLALFLGESLPDASATMLKQMTRQVRDDAFTVARRNRPLLRRLGQRYRLAIISNFHGNLEICLEELGLLSFFEMVTDSAVVGIRKGDRRIFQGTLSALGARPSNSWMIGDDVDLDLLPAATIGMRTCAIGKDVSPPRGFRPTLIVPGLKELVRRWAG